MALTIRYIPGYTWTVGEVVTATKLNLANNPTIELEGTISASSIPDGSVDNDKLQPGAVGQTDRIADEVITTAKIHKDSRQASLIGATRGLVIKNNSAAWASKIDITATEIILKNSSGGALNVSIPTGSPVTLDIAGGVGLNALETGGSETGDTWYYIWLLSDGANVKGVFSTSSTAPDLSGGAFNGYVYKALLGAIRNGNPGGSSSDLINGFYQLDRQVWIRESNVFSARAGGAAGVFDTLKTTDLAAFQNLVPPIAKTFWGNVGRTDSAAVDAGIQLASYVNSASEAVGSNMIVPARGLATAQLNFTAGVPFGPIPLGVTQNFVWRVSEVTSSRWRLNVSGYSI